MSPVIRAANPNDLNDIIELTKEIAQIEKAAFDPKGKVEKLNQALFSTPPHLYCLLVEQEKTIIGFATYSTEFSLFEADIYLRINSLYIKPASRRQSLGTSLINELKTQSRKLNCKSIRFFTPDFNNDAIAFYHSIGAKSLTAVRFYLDASNS